MSASAFYPAARGARKILVCDLGFLGDTIHLFPALREVRAAWPEAALHVMAADHVKDLLRLLPGIGPIWGYPRHPKSPPWYRLLPLVRALRRERFDAVINLNGSNRSSLLTRLTGAPLRLGRTPERRGGPLWPLCFTHAVTVPYDEETPLFAQRWRCLEAAGLPVSAPRFEAAVPPEEQAAADALLDGISGFVHVSPFTTMDAKELHPDDLARALDALMARFPGVPWAVSCAGNERERTKLAALLARLERKPWKTFPGTLTPLRLAAAMRRARLHVGGDSGGVHLATLLGVPSVAWFRQEPPLTRWTPRGGRDRVLHAPNDGSGFLRLAPEPFLAAAAAIL